MRGVLRSHSRPLLGLAYLVILALLIATSVAAYRKDLPWQRTAQVTLTTTRPGLELNPQSDVKLQGMRVGEVRGIRSNGRSATVVIALDKDKLDLIPVNIDAAIIPKTLFGEKFVDLRVPRQASAARIADGDSIRQSTTSVELGTTFSRLVPILRTLRPEELSIMLTALADALDGRGATLARTLNQVRGLADELGPHMDTLTHDFRQLAATADIYSAGAPDLIRMLASTSAISSDLLVPEEKDLSTFLDQVTNTADQGREVLAENSKDLVTLTGEARPVLALLEEYSSGLPCLLDGLHTNDILANQVTGARGPFVNLTVDLVTARKPYRYPEDLPGNPAGDAHNSNLPDSVPRWGPHCPEFASYVTKLRDAAPYSQSMPGTAIPGNRGTASSPTSVPLGSAVQEARAALARAQSAQLLGMSQDELPPYAELLLAPLLADGQVTVR